MRASLRGIPFASEDACSHSAAGNLLEVQTLQNKFNKLQEKLHETNVAKRQATQAAQHWQKACLAARAHNNLPTQENHQLKQERQKLGDWLASTADVPKHPKQPAGAPPEQLMPKRQTKANGKGKSNGKVFNGKKPKMSLATPIGAEVKSEE